MPKRKKMWPVVRRRERPTGVDYVIDCGRIDGKRKTYVRKSREEADSLAQDLRIRKQNLGRAAHALSMRQSLEAAQCFSMLTGERSDVTLTEAVQFFLDHAPRQSKDKTVQCVYDEFMVRCGAQSLKSSTVRGYRSSLRPFIETFGKDPIAGITKHRVREWFTDATDGYSATTVQNHLRAVGVYFNFAVREEYIADNPTAQIECPKAVRQQPRFLSVQDVRSLLAAAQDECPVMVPRLVLGLFLGIRREEQRRLTWHEVNFADDIVTVPATAAKIQRTRHVTMEANAKAWLVAYRRTDGAVGPGEASYNRHMKTLRATAGITEWPNNALRHTYASYHYAMFRDPARTCVELGHVGSQSVLYDHYRGLATHEQAKEFWAIRPKRGKADGVVPFAVAS